MGRSRRHQKKQPKLICLCNSVSEETIVEAIQDGAQNLDEIFDRTTAGVGPCGGSCRRDLKLILDLALGQTTKKKSSP